MPSSLGLEIKTAAYVLRRQGYSFSEIAKYLNVSKSTASYWLKNIELGKVAQEKLRLKVVSGRFNARIAKKKKAETVENIIREIATSTVQGINLDTNINKLLCSIFIWTEGGERSGNRISFVNSSPLMIKVFLYLLRRSYKLEERKFKALIHIHKYHNEEDIRNYWSNITEIPLPQFYKSYVKLNSGKNIREGYKGCINVRYYDSKIVSELRMIYNMFAKRVLKEGV